MCILIHLFLPLASSEYAIVIIVKVSGLADFYKESVVYENKEVFNMTYQATIHTLYMPTRN